MKSTRLQTYFLFVFMLLGTLPTFAGPSRTTYQAKIIKPDGYPLEAINVNFKFTILDPAGACILYSETYSSVNMSATGGLISFALGSGVKTYPVSATTFEQVFSNITPNLSCDVGGPVSYAPLVSDIRKIVMQFHDGGGWQTLPAMSINAVPYAMYANESLKLNGKTDADFVEVANIPSCLSTEALRYNGTSFSCISTANVSGAAVVAALGYTPATGASVTALVSSLLTTDSTVFAVSATVASLSNSVSTLQSTAAASFAAITSSQWTTSGTAISYSTGNVGIGTTTPVTKLDVSGGVRIGAESTTCAPALAGTLRYTASNVEYCNGTSWQAFGVSGAGITNFNGSTSGTQSFATGTGGTAPNFSTLNGVHALNVPLASAGSVTAGLISNADYTTFTNKITSSAVSIAQVLGYVPADNAASGTYAQKANNLSDLANIATARTNLGLGTFATASSIDLGSASATGTLAIARLPSFAGDAAIAAASNTIILSNSGVLAGTYTKVTVDTKGRVTSSAALASSDITTALGYAPVSSTASTQWTTSGSAIYYNTGNVGVGTGNPGMVSGSDAYLTLAKQTGKISLELYSSGNYSEGTDAGKIDFINRSTIPSDVNVARISSQVGTSTTRAHLAFFTRGLSGVLSQRMLINENGYVGIGVSNPVTALSNVAATANHANVGDQGGTGENSNSLNWSTNASGYSAAITNVSNSVGANGLNIRILGATVNHTVLAVGTGVSSSANTADYLTVKGSGNVGIGITAPTAKLHLAAGTSSTAALKFTSGILLTSAESGAMEYDGFNFYVTDSTNTRRTIATGSVSGTIDNASNINSSGNITLSSVGSVIVSNTTASTNSSTGSLVVNGGVGVAGSLNVAGTISGAARVLGTGFRANQGVPDVADSSTNGYAFGADGDTGVFSPGSGGANGVVAIYSNDVERLRVHNNGFVGIGTSSPSSTAHIAGNLTLGTYGGSQDDNGDYTIKSNGQLHLQANQSGSSNTSYVHLVLAAGVSTSANSAVIMQTLGSERMRVGPTGNVGIGTTNPSYKLDIANQLRVGAQGGGDVSVLNGGAGYGANLDLYNASGTLTTKVSANNNSYFNFGNVGIGDTSPDAKLDIFGARQNSITPANAIFKFGGADVFLYGGAHDGVGGPTYPIMLQAMRDSDSQPFPIVLNPNGGAVGVNTLSPTAALEVSGTILSSSGLIHSYTNNPNANPHVTITAGPNAAFPVIQLNDQRTGGKSFNIESGRLSSGTFSIRDNVSGTERLVITSTGKIGIGTVAPQSKFDITETNGYLRSNTADGGLEIASGNDESSYIDFRGHNNLVLDYAGRVEYKDDLGMGFSVNNSASPSIYIASATGYVAIGAGYGGATSNLMVNSNSANGYTIISNKNSAAGGSDWRWYSSSTGAPLGTDSMCFGQGACMLSIYGNGNAVLSGVFTHASDGRLKREITSIPNALDKISQIEGVTYYWKQTSRDQTKQVGLIAQQVEKVFPELVKTNAEGIKSVAYQNLVAPIINAIKEIREWMFKTDERVIALEKQNAELKQRLEQLEKSVNEKK